MDRSSESLFFPTGQSLTYLDGSAPADFGFDPLGLSDPEGAGGLINPAWLSYACASPPPANPRGLLAVSEPARGKHRRLLGEGGAAGGGPGMQRSADGSSAPALRAAVLSLRAVR